MSDYIVYAVVQNRSDLEQIVHELQRLGISSSDISFLSHAQEFPELKNKLDQKRNWRTEIHTKAPEGATAGAATGGIIGGLLGLMAGFGVLIIPGLAPLVAAGPLLAALSGIGAGGTVGSVLGALIGTNLPEHDAAFFEKRLKEGAILLTLHIHSDENEKQVRKVLSKYCGNEFSSIERKTVNREVK
jgi:hypothetical protein